MLAGCGQSTKTLSAKRISDIFVREYRTCRNISHARTNDAYMECAYDRTRKVLAAMRQSDERCLLDIAAAWSRLAEDVAARKIDPGQADRRFKAAVELLSVVCDGNHAAG